MLSIRPSAADPRRITAFLSRAARPLALLLSLLLLAPPTALAAGPSLSVSPTGQGIGDPVAVSGSGFTPGSTIALTLDEDPLATTPSPVMADQTGSFSGVTFTVPAGAGLGANTVGASDGTNSATAPLDVLTPGISVSPSSGGAGDPLTVSGAGWPVGDEIQVQIGGSTVCQLVASVQGSVSGDQANGCRVPPGLSAGIYPLTAADLMNTSEQATGTGFTVPAGPLVAAFSPTSANVLAGSPVAFDASGSSDPGGDITSYAWNFGDGASATGLQTSHRYLNVGTFPVTLTVANGSGTSSVTHQVTVTAPSPMQTLILTPIANPTIVNFAPVSTTRSGTVRLGKRLFCPGAGPGCTASVLATSSSLAHGGAPPPSSGIFAGSARAAAGARAGTATIVIGPNHSAAVTFKLSKRALALLRERHHLPARVKIVVSRGDQTTISRLALTLRLR